MKVVEEEEGWVFFFSFFSFENEAIGEADIESRSDGEISAAIDEVFEEQCGEQKQRKVTC